MTWATKFYPRHMDRIMGSHAHCWSLLVAPTSQSIPSHAILILDRPSSPNMLTIKSHNTRIGYYGIERDIFMMGYYKLQNACWSNNPHGCWSYPILQKSYCWHCCLYLAIQRREANVAHVCGGHGILHLSLR